MDPNFYTEQMKRITTKLTSIADEYDAATVVYDHENNILKKELENANIKLNAAQEQIDKLKAILDEREAIIKTLEKISSINNKKYKPVLWKRWRSFF